MKISDVLYLSSRKIKGDLRRSLMLMVVIGAVLGLVFVLQLIFHGIVRNYIEIGGAATDGRVIMTVPGEGVDDVSKFGGEIWGEARYYGAYGGIVLGEDLVRGAVEVGFDRVPEDAVPVLVPEYIGEVFLGVDYGGGVSSAERKIHQYEEYRKNVIGEIFVGQDGVKYFVAGLSPGSFTTNNLSFRGVERSNASVLNPVLEQIAMPGGMLIAIDDGREWTRGAERDEGRVLVSFADIKQAYRYFLKGRGRFMGVDFPGKEYEVNVITGVSPEVYYVMKIMQVGLNVFCGILMAIAMVVAGFTFVRLVKQDEENIKLYYSLGATAGQVRMLYAMYFLELVIGAAVLALVVAISIVIGYSVANQELLRAVFELGFSASEVPYIILW